MLMVMLHVLLCILICVTGALSYAFGLRDIFRHHYRPNLFSRVIWALLAINSLVAVIVSHSTTSSIILGLVFAAGSVSILLASLKYGRVIFGRLEIACGVLLVISIVIWIIFRAPLVNLGIGLLAHFLGAIPNFRQTWQKPHIENKKFWGLFFASSALSLMAGIGQPIILLILPLYLTAHDGLMFGLCFKKSSHHK